MYYIHLVSLSLTFSTIDKESQKGGTPEDSKSAERTPFCGFDAGYMALGIGDITTVLLSDTWFFPIPC